MILGKFPSTEIIIFWAFTLKTEYIQSTKGQFVHSARNVHHIDVLLVAPQRDYFRSGLTSKQAHFNCFAYRESYIMSPIIILFALVIIFCTSRTIWCFLVFLVFLAEWYVLCSWKRVFSTINQLVDFSSLDS